MHVVIAIDSFKGSLSSLEAAEAAKEGLLRAKPDAQVTIFPMADKVYSFLKLSSSNYLTYFVCCHP